MENEFLSVSQYCAKYHKDVGNVRRLLIAGRLKGIKVGSQWVIPANELPPPDMRKTENRTSN